MAKINVVEFNNDASVVASGKSLRCPLSMVTPMPTAIALGSYDSTVKLWDLRYVLTLFYLLAYHVRSRSISAQNRQPIQALEEARDAVQTLHVGSSRIMTGSVDGHVRTYDLRKGELRADYIGRTLLHP